MTRICTNNTLHWPEQSPPRQPAARPIADQSLSQKIRRSSVEGTTHLHLAMSRSAGVRQRTTPDKIVGSTLYFMRVDSDGEFTQAGQSYGTVWSRLALQSSIKTFGLWNDDPQMIDIKQYNVLSYDYFA